MTAAATVSLASAAAWYTKRGLRVFPCRTCEKVPATAHGLLDASCDLRTVDEWWRRNSDFNIGIATGKDIFVLDVDGEAGEQSLDNLEKEFGALPRTPQATTGKGRHIYFRHPESVSIRNSASKLSPGIDVRGQGGYVIAPPSVHPNGRRYQWRDGHRVNQIEIAPAPSWLLDLLVSPALAEHEQAHTTPSANSAYARKALAEEIAAVASAESGHRNDVLNRSAFALGQLVGAGALDRAAVEGTLTAAASASGLAAAEIARTIKSGIESGMRHPREIPAGAEMVDNNAKSRPEFKEASEWPVLDVAARHGFVGELVETIEPHTEADPVALIAQFLIALGSAIGRGPHFMAEQDRHGCNLFLVLAADSSKGRKGTSWSHIRRLVTSADPTWEFCLESGLSSGEGIIYRLRDATERDDEPGDGGVVDKRLLVFEGEYASVLKVAMREGSTLSAVIRNAWDGIRLSTLTRNNPLRATNPHLSIIGHITREELTRHLTETEAGNGFANRFLWFATRRSKLLPEGGRPDVHRLQRLADMLREILVAARGMGELRRDNEARDVWREVYPALSAGAPGLLGAVTARAEAQTMRLAMLYALLDLSPAICREHLEAGLALWTYSERSARLIFGDRLGDPVGDTILLALRGDPAGLTRTELHKLFGGHKAATKIDQRLADLQARGLVRKDRVRTGGRDAEVWRATQ